MKLRFIYGIIPILVIFSNKLVPKKFSAFCWWLLIVVRSDELKKSALIEHELVHSRQLTKYLVIPFVILYWTNSKWRLKFELEAYMTQLESRSETISDVAEFLYLNYNLNIPKVRLMNIVLEAYNAETKKK